MVPNINTARLNIPGAGGHYGSAVRIRRAPLGATGCVKPLVCFWLVSSGGYHYSGASSKSGFSAFSSHDAVARFRGHGTGSRHFGSGIYDFGSQETVGEGTSAFGRDRAREGDSVAFRVRLRGFVDDVQALSLSLSVASGGPS